MEHCNNCDHNSNQNCCGNNIYISGTETKRAINVSNNKARYYAELAESYKNEAKEMRDSAQYYAEQNADVTMEYIDSLEVALKDLINEKQDAGDYASSSDVPVKLSDLEMDSTFLSSIPVATTSSLGFAYPDGKTIMIDGNGQLSCVSKILQSDKLTNCITEIPQDIKLELSNGTLTLKAGSKVYVPNGFESDGTTPKFDVVTINSDITYSGGTSGYTGKRYIFYDTVSGNLQTGNHSESGTSNTASATYTVYYHTGDNKIYSCTSSTTLNKTQLGSLPICIVNSVSGGYIIGSIDRVLNGFGFVGSKLFVLPNVKALFADGRNDDGSYKNNEYTFSNVAISADINPGATPRTITISPGGIGYMTSSLYLIGSKKDMPATVATTGRYRYYAVDENIWYTTSGSTTANWIPQQAVCVGGFIGDGTYITDFNLIQMPAKIVDTNDVDGQWITASTDMISSSTTINASTTKNYDLSTYLPNDGFDYEVIVTANGQTGSTSGNIAEIGVGSSYVDVNTNRITDVITRTSSTMQWGWSGIIPIGGDRKIYIRQIYSSASCSCQLFRCKAYRRLGRNA